jgi:hypothetical protein
VTRYPGGSFTLVVSALRSVRYHVVLDVVGIRVDGLAHSGSANCRSRASTRVCRAGPFEAIPRGFSPWHVAVVKTSRPAAHVRVRLQFGE